MTKCYKRGYLQLHQRLPSCHGRTLSQKEKKSDSLKLVYLKRIVIYKCENKRLYFFWYCQSHFLLKKKILEQVLDQTPLNKI